MVIEVETNHESCQLYMDKTDCTYSSVYRSGGCTSNSKTSCKDEGCRRKVLSDAFSNKDCPYLFMSGREDRLKTLLGSSLPEGFKGRIGHTSDGRTLRIQDRMRMETQCYILEAGQAPRIIDTPRGAFLNRDNQVVLRCESFEKGEVFFPNGSSMRLPKFIVDADGQYLCVGGRYFDYEANAVKVVPITIRNVNMPEKILATCRMSGILWRSFCFRDKLYVFVRQYPEGRGAGGMMGEIYHHQGDQLDLLQSIKIEDPLFLSDFVLVDDISPDQAYAIVFANRDAPLGSHCYLFDVKKHTFKDLGSEAVRYYTCFLDQHVFDGLIEKAAPQPPDKK